MRRIAVRARHRSIRTSGDNRGDLNDFGLYPLENSDAIELLSFAEIGQEGPIVGVRDAPKPRNRFGIQ